MAEALGIDTSSYPRPGAQPSPLDIAGKLGSMQSQALQINQQKLSQANEAMTYLTRAMSAIGPDGTKDQFKRAGADTVAQGLAPANMLGVWNKKIDDAPTPRAIWDEFVTTAAQHQEIINHHLGQIRPTDTGQGVRLDQIPNKGGQGTPRAFIPHEIPLTQPQIGAGNATVLTGPQSKRPIAPGVDSPLGLAPVFGPRGTATSSSASLRPLPPASAGVTRLGSPATYDSGTLVKVPTDPSSIAPGTGGANGLGGQPTGPMTGLPPDYEPGLKQLTEDRAATAQTLRSIKPALQAFPLLKDLTTGIGTETVNKALAGLSNLGWLPQDVTDKVAAYQIVNKKLADYLRTNPVGQRSDAAQALSQSASPDPKGQINAALVKLIPDAVALDRARALASISFTDERGNRRIDYNNYSHHAATFPPKIDERALKLDFMHTKDRNALIDEMEKKKNTIESKKFLYTYELAEKNGLFER